MSNELRLWCKSCCGLREQKDLNTGKTSICIICNGFGWTPYEPIWEGNIEDIGLDKQLPLLGEVPISWKGLAVYVVETDGTNK